MRQFMISFKTNCRDNDKCSRERNHFCLHIEEGWKQELLEIDDLWVWNQPTGLFNWKFLVIICFFFLLWWWLCFVCLFVWSFKKKKKEEVANIKNGKNAASSPGRSFQTKLFIVEIWKNRVKKEHPTQAFLPTVQSLSQHCKHGDLYSVFPAVQIAVNNNLEAYWFSKRMVLWLFAIMKWMTLMFTYSQEPSYSIYDMPHLLSFILVVS